MKATKPITEKATLAQYDQISTFVYHVLSVAQAGGMEEKRAHKIYKEVMDSYLELKGDAFWLFRDEIIRILVTSDADYKNVEEGSISDFGPRSRN